MMRSILLVMIIAAAGFIAAIRFLPWWGVLALCAALALSLPALLKWGLRRLLTAPFKAKGAVLRGAEAHVHSVERTEPPMSADADEDETEGAEAGPREHYRIDVTITPRPSSGPFTLWEPGELMIVGATARPGEPDDAEMAGRVSTVEIQHEGRFHADEGMKYHGPLHLRLHAAVPAGQRSVRFRYYFEVFGRVPLPQHRLATR